MSPKSKEQYEEIRLRTTAAIKEAALELFAKFGYHSTLISQIAKAAGVSKGLMYNYFDSKEALLHEIITDAMEEGEALLVQVFQKSNDPYEQLVLIVESTVEWVTTKLHYWKLLTSLAFQVDVLKGLEKELEKMQGVAIHRTVDLFERLGAEKPMEEALLFGAVLDGVMLNYMQMENNYPMEAMKEYVLERFKPKKGS